MTECKCPDHMKVVRARFYKGGWWFYFADSHEAWPAKEAVVHPDLCEGYKLFAERHGYNEINY